MNNLAKTSGIPYSMGQYYIFQEVQLAANKVDGMFFPIFEI
jgi:hypothetical protein